MRSFAVVPVLCVLALAACSSADGELTDTEESSVVDSTSPALIGGFDHQALPGTVKEFDKITFRTGGKYLATKTVRGAQVREQGSFTTSKKGKIRTVVLKPTLALSRSDTFELGDDRSSLQLTRSGRSEVFFSDGAFTCASDVDCDTGAKCKFTDTSSRCEKPPVDPGSCATRRGGAFVTFDVHGERIQVWSTNAEFVTEAKALLVSGDHRTPNFKTVIDGKDCDSKYSWHVDPAEMAFADFTTEVCDGLPSYVEAHKKTWMSQVGNYCPWGPTVVAVDARP